MKKLSREDELGAMFSGRVTHVKKRGPRAFDELKEPQWAGRLIVHRDGTISVQVYRRPKWRWLRHGEDIQQRDFKRLSVKNRQRIRKLEALWAREMVVPDYDY
jgi:hypothetical protein